MALSNQVSSFISALTKLVNVKKFHPILNRRPARKLVAPSNRRSLENVAPSKRGAATEDCAAKSS